MECAKARGCVNTPTGIPTKEHLRKTSTTEWVPASTQQVSNSCIPPRSGDVYRGDWRDGFREGQGSVSCANGTHHTGRYVKGQRSGPGTFRNVATGESYTG